MWYTTVFPHDSYWFDWITYIWSFLYVCGISNPGRKYQWKLHLKKILKTKTETEIYQVFKLKNKLKIITRVFNDDAVLSLIRWIISTEESFTTVRSYRKKNVKFGKWLINLIKEKNKAHDTLIKFPTSNKKLRVKKIVFTFQIELKREKAFK